MPYGTLGSHPGNLRIVVQSGDDTRPSPVDEDEELIPPPRPGQWAITLIDDGNQHLLSIDEATPDDLADFLARLTVQAATAMRAAGVDLASRIEASLTVAGLRPGGDPRHHLPTGRNPMTTCTNQITNSSDTDVTAYVTRDDIVNLVKLLLPMGTDGTIFLEVPIPSTTVNDYEEGPACVHRAAHQIATLANSGHLNEGEWPELYEHPGELIEEDDPDADRRAAQEIVALLREAYRL